MVFFCVKRNIPVSPSSSFLPFARFLGFRVPVFSSLPSSPSPAVPSLPLPSLALPSVPVSLSSGPVSVPLSPALSFLSSSSVSLSARSVVSCGSVVSFSSSVLCPRVAPSLSSSCSLPSSFSLSSSAPQFSLLSAPSFPSAFFSCLSFFLPVFSLFRFSLWCVVFCFSVLPVLCSRPLFSPVVVVWSSGTMHHAAPSEPEDAAMPSRPNISTDVWNSRSTSAQLNLDISLGPATREIDPHSRAALPRRRRRPRHSALGPQWAWTDAMIRERSRSRSDSPVSPVGSLS